MLEAVKMHFMAKRIPKIDEMEGELLTTGEAAKILGLTNSGVIWKADTGKLPCLRVGKQRLFRRSDVAAMKRERER